MDKAFNEIESELGKGCLLCLFPEGKFTLDGNLQEFKLGIESIIKTSPVPVIPMGLSGQWGSYWSVKDGDTFFKWPKRVRAKVKLKVGKVIPPQKVKASYLREIVGELIEKK